MTAGQLRTNQKIHPTQALWQVFEIGMNSWILYAMITAGLTLPLIVWTVFEVVMNSWILFTMMKVGINRKGTEADDGQRPAGHPRPASCEREDGSCACICLP